MERAGRSGRREDGVQDYMREKQLKKKEIFYGFVFKYILRVANWVQIKSLRISLNRKHFSGKKF